MRRELRVVHGPLGDHRVLQHLRHVVLFLEGGEEDGAEEAGLEEPDEGPKAEAREVRRLHRPRLVAHGGDVDLRHRRHRPRLPLGLGVGSAAHLGCPVGCGPEQQSKWGIADARRELGRERESGDDDEQGGRRRRLRS